MSYSTHIRILYMGRKAQIFDQLQMILAEQNHLAGHRAYTGSHNGLPLTHMVDTQADNPWPLVEATMATSQKNALQLIRTQPPAIVLVELDQKSASRLRFCDIIRYRLPAATVLAVTANLPNSTFAFDDVINLPLVPTRVVNVVKRFSEKRIEHLLQLGPISLNMATRTVTTPNGRYTMTPKQCALLKLLMSEHGEVVERGKIMETVWETSYLEDTRTLDVHIRWLRERIEHNPSRPVYLQTVRGVGYRFEVKELSK